jgi:hypothetical protein
MAQEAPPTPQQEHHQQPSPGSHRSRSGADFVIKTALISAVVICMAALLVPWRLSAVIPAQRAAAAPNTASVPALTSPQVYALPPTLVAPPILTTLPFPKPKPRLHPQAATPMLAGVPGDWTLKFGDEFSGTSLNSAEWSTGWYGSGVTPPVNSIEKDCYDPAEVSEGGGVLSLSLVQKSENCGGQKDYAGGLVSTMGKFSFTYGFVETRLWLPGVPGNPGDIANWPGLWTDGRNWPEDGEIDVAEGIHGQVCGHFHGPDNPSGVSVGCPSVNYTNGWHTFAVNWEPGSITYYYDGVDIGNLTSGITSAPMFIVLQNAAGGDLSMPATEKVDYVRVWQHT